jgi:hypothetical protein
VDGIRTDPAVIGVYVDVAAAHDGDYVPAGEAVTVFEDRRDAERGRRFDDEASVVEEHPHTGDDRRLLDQDGVVSDQEEVVQDGRYAERMMVENELDAYIGGFHMDALTSGVSLNVDLDATLTVVAGNLYRLLARKYGATSWTPPSPAVMLL